jgi:hypothetical protein
MSPRFDLAGFQPGDQVSDVYAEGAADREPDSDRRIRNSTLDRREVIRVNADAPCQLLLRDSSPATGGCDPAAKFGQRRFHFGARCGHAVTNPTLLRTRDECASCGGGASQRPFDDDLLRKAITLDDPLIPEKEAAHIPRSQRPDTPALSENSQNSLRRDCASDPFSKVSDRAFPAAEHDRRALIERQGARPRRDIRGQSRTTSQQQVQQQLPIVDDSKVITCSLSGRCGGQRIGL